MLQLVTIKMNDWSASRTFGGFKICTSRAEPKCDVGDIFPVEYSGMKKYYKVLDIWEVDKNFISKFLWRLEGAESPQEILQILNGIYPDKLILYVHFYNEIDIPEDIILQMVNNHD